MKAILTYHSIDASGSPISVEAATFRSHVEWLARSGVSVVALEDLPAFTDAIDAVAITFDDAFVNFATEAWPLLKDYALPVTIFVVSEYAGRTNSWKAAGFPDVPQQPLLNWDTVGRLAEAGVNIGSHTRRHRDLRRLSIAEVIDEVAGGADHIESKTGVRPHSFAYPYGAYNTEVTRAVGESHTWACTTAFRPLSAHDAALELPRLDCFYFRQPGLLESWGTARFRGYLWMRAKGRRLREAIARTGVN